MRYIKAEEVLPEEVISLIQQYVDGVSIYIPRKAGSRRNWGDGTDYREELTRRNQCIREAYAQGSRICDLALEYHLSEKSIGRILREK